jgi:hypothetical protein
MSAEAEPNDVALKQGGSSLQDKLFNLRMKINQGRKANKEEVEEEYKRLSNPKYEQKQRYLQKVAEAEAEGEVKGSGAKWREESAMQQTAEQAAFAAEKAQKKAENTATFGWQAFTTEATHRAYEKKLKKLPSVASSSSKAEEGASSHLQENPLDYGKVGATVSKSGLDRLAKDIEEREEARKNFSKRRMNFESSDVDYINDRNAVYNKKLKRAFDKYTVEIRQNLERGTAV